ncbi:hypothetical protein Tco_1133332 [Tanacetum coccineum]
MYTDQKLRKSVPTSKVEWYKVFGIGCSMRVIGIQKELVRDNRIRERERGRCGEMMTMVMLGWLWCGCDDGSGYDIVGMVVMRCDEDGGGGMMKVAAGCGVRRRVEARSE